MSRAVITGCTKGIGAAIARALMQRGEDVIGCYSGDVKAAEVFLKSAEHYMGKCELLQADLSSCNEVDKFVLAVRERAEYVDHLILNTAITDRTPYRLIERDSWRKVLRCNLEAPLFIAQGVDDILRPGGGIIFIGSVMGQHPHAMSLSYAVSKAALHQLARNLVKEYADRNITVNVVAPGFVETPWQTGKTPEHRGRIENRIALKRFANPDEIAALCLAVIDNPYINGAILSIDGGYDCL